MESHAVDAKALEKLKGWETKNWTSVCLMIESGSCGQNAHFRGMDTAFSVKHYAGTVT
jgi:hypothetical protein